MHIYKKVRADPKRVYCPLNLTILTVFKPKCVSKENIFFKGKKKKRKT